MYRYRDSTLPKFRHLRVKRYCRAGRLQSVRSQRSSRETGAGSSWGNICGVNVQPLGDAFETEGTYSRSQRIEEGHINDTFILTYATENGEHRYVLQRINRTVFPDVPAVMENIAR